jgi:hypothetical protein
LKNAKRTAEWLGVGIIRPKHAVLLASLNFAPSSASVDIMPVYQSAIDDAVRLALAEQAATAAARSPKRKGIRGVVSRLFDKVF